MSTDNEKAINAPTEQEQLQKELQKQVEILNKVKELDDAKKVELTTELKSPENIGKVKKEIKSPMEKYISKIKDKTNPSPDQKSVMDAFNKLFPADKSQDAAVKTLEKSDKFDAKKLIKSEDVKTLEAAGVKMEGNELSFAKNSNVEYFDNATNKAIKLNPNQNAEITDDTAGINVTKEGKSTVIHIENKNKTVDKITITPKETTADKNGLADNEGTVKYGEGTKGENTMKMPNSREKGESNEKVLKEKQLTDQLTKTNNPTINLVNMADSIRKGETKEVIEALSKIEILNKADLKELTDKMTDANIDAMKKEINSMRNVTPGDKIALGRVLDYVKVSKQTTFDKMVKNGLVIESTSDIALVHTYGKGNTIESLKKLPDTIDFSKQKFTINEQGEIVPFNLDKVENISKLNTANIKKESHDMLLKGGFKIENVLDAVEKLPQGSMLRAVMEFFCELLGLKKKKESKEELKDEEKIIKIDFMIGESGKDKRGYEVDKMFDKGEVKDSLLEPQQKYIKDVQELVGTSEVNKDKKLVYGEYTKEKVTKIQEMLIKANKLKPEEIKYSKGVMDKKTLEDYKIFLENAPVKAPTTAPEKKKEEEKPTVAPAATPATAPEKKKEEEKPAPAGVTIIEDHVEAIPVGKKKVEGFEDGQALYIKGKKVNFRTLSEDGKSLEEDTKLSSKDIVTVDASRSAYTMEGHDMVPVKINGVDGYVAKECLSIDAAAPSKKPKRKNKPKSKPRKHK